MNETKTSLNARLLFITDKFSDPMGWEKSERNPLTIKNIIETINNGECNVEVINDELEASNTELIVIFRHK